jgi:Inward rectifier potassium channel C-terminal domain
MYKESMMYSIVNPICHTKKQTPTHLPICQSAVHVPPLCSMFRVADIRKRTAVAPHIRAVLYTWGPGHTTAEGEHVPVLVQPLPLHYLDETLLLPVVVEHTIDERSPLYGAAVMNWQAHVLCACL